MIRIIDLVWWCCLGAIAWVLLLMMLGCGVLDNIDTIATVAEQVQEQGAVIQEQVEDEDWLGMTESILIGAGAVLSAFGAKKGWDKVKKKEG